jgi:hypothetical protein
MRMPEVGEDLRGKVCVDCSGRVAIVTRRISGEWVGMEITNCPKVFWTSTRNKIAVAHESLCEFVDEMTQP